MPSPRLATKVYPPRLRKGFVDRPRLRGLLEQGAQAALTLVSAPPGFGKSTLLAEWLAARQGDGRVSGWLSLDEADNEPAAFWSQVVAALDAAGENHGTTLLPMIEAGQPDRAFVIALLNALDASPAVVDLVLDDYHVITHPAVEAGVAFLLDHLSPHIHVVVGTRADPALPLARLRARGELVEIRSADLRFTPEEAAAFLNDAMGLRLAGADVAALETRTEGWIAALKLAALSLQGRSDAAGFVAGFAGNDRYIVDYLVEEVLKRQSPGVRSFLLDTCILDRLSGPLCDAVTGGHDSRAMLEALDRQNLFVVALDDRREWYRYHHLFADVLQAHVTEERRADMPALHRRASDWFEGHGERREAIRHALAAKDFERAGDLVERALPEARLHRRDALMREWLRALPNALVRARPGLAIGLMGAVVSNGEFEGMEERLRAAEEQLAQDISPELPEDQRRGLLSAAELYRAALAQVSGDLPGVVTHARRALDLAPAGEHLLRAGPAGFLGIAHWTEGDLDGALRGWRECAEGLTRAGHIADVMGTAIAMADILLVQGRLREAVRTCERALALVPEGGAAFVRGVADVHATLGDLHRERNDLTAAREHLSRVEALGEYAGLPQRAWRLRVAAARLRQVEGATDEALDLLDEAERVYASDFFPNVRPIEAMKARLNILERRLAEARHWQRDAGVSVADELTFLREFEHITLARLLLAQAARARQNEADALPGLLDRLLAAAEAGGRSGSIIEISALQALAHAQRGDTSGALAALERALTLAAPEGYARVFIDEGEAMAALLRLAVKRGIAPAFARTLLAGFAPVEAKAPPPAGPIEPLSERELDVLRLLKSDLDGPDIARELAISLNTMRTHTKRIYEKLGANNRRTAVRRAEEFGLLAR